MKNSGCHGYIVTARQDGVRCGILREFELLVDKVYFTSFIAKQDIVDADIWIDDFQLTITHWFTPVEKLIEGER